MQSMFEKNVLMSAINHSSSINRALYDYCMPKTFFFIISLKWNATLSKNKQVCYYYFFFYFYLLLLWLFEKGVQVIILNSCKTIRKNLSMLTKTTILVLEKTKL